MLNEPGDSWLSPIYI